MLLCVGGEQLRQSSLMQCWSDNLGLFIGHIALNRHLSVMKI